jgi:sulfopyruvate decarboxylase TPP-binding subunit
VLTTLKRNGVRLIPYVRDRVLMPLVKAVHADPLFTTFATSREEEAIGIITSGWMGGTRGAVLMQTSGFATIPNVLAPLVLPCQIPPSLFVSERGTLETVRAVGGRQDEVGRENRAGCTRRVRPLSVHR